MEASGSIIISGVIDGISITSANVLYALQSTANYNNGQTPGDTAFTYDNFPPLNAGYYVWQATKITDSDGKTSITGKMCLGPTTDFLEGTEVYATDASNTTPPANSSFGTTYTKEKGKYLWTATRVKYANQTDYTYLNKKCVGYWGEDGNGIQSIARTYARSKKSTSTNDTTAPTDIDTSIGTSGWAATSPSVNETYPYLWVKEVVTYTKSTATTKYYCIGARGANGVDAQDIEWVYIRTKTNVAPVISGDGGSSPYTDHNSKTYTSDDHLPKVVAGSGGSLTDIEDGNSGNTSKKYECTDDPKGVDSTWKYEWEIKREKGAADANGHRTWQAYSGTMTLHNRMPVSIASANVWYALSDSGTTAPADSVFDDAQTGFDDFPPLNSGKYIWQATKITDSDGKTSITGKMCLGPTTDFLEGTEVYAISTSNSTAPAENTTNWKTTYSKTKGYYLWTATRVKYANQTDYTYLNKKCVGYWGEDGATGYSIALTLIRNNLYTDANWNTYAELGHSENYSKRTGDSDFTACRVSDYFVVTGTSSDSGKNHTAIYKCTSVNANSITGTCVSHTKDGEKGDDAQYIYLKGSAFNKDSAGTNVAASEIKVNGGSNLATQSRGLCLVTLNRQTLAVVDSATIYDTYEGTTGKNNLITKLNSLGTNVFVCLVSYDAIGWSDTLISTLQSFGMSDLPYTSANRYPFLFIGYKNLGKGNGITRMNDMEEPAIPVELGVYVANGALSVKDGKDGEDGDDAVTYDIVLNTAWAKVDSSGIITAGLAGTAYKIVGSTRSVLTNTTIRHGYILNDSETYADTTTDGGGNFDTGTWFNGDYQNEYAKGSKNIFAAIVIGGSVKCVKYVTIANQGDKGATGRMYYIAGKFPEKAPYTRTAKLCPVVYYSPYWWYLDADSATGSDTPSDSNSSKWKKLENYGVVLTDAIFVKNFAQFGAAIITGDWLISVHGTINGVYYGGSVEAPGEYNNRAAYTYFDPAYPMGFESFQIPVKTEEIDKGYSTEWIRITNNFSLTAGTYIIRITCHVNSSDTMHLRLFDDNDSSDAYYLGSTTSDEVVTLVYTKTITTGSSKFNLRAGMNANGEIGYIDSIEIESTDARFIPNYAVDLRTGRTYQNDANIRGKIVTIGPSSKVEISDGVIKLYGAYNFPNIVLGVDANGCAVLNFYDKNGMFTYGLGPIEAERTQSQAESFTLQYYNIDDGSYDATEIPNSAIVTVYRYMFKSQVPPSSTFLKKYLAKIMANAYFGGNYCASGEEARYFNGKFIKASYHSPFQTGDVYGGGIVVTCNNPQSGIISSKETMLNGRSIEELELRNYNVMQDSDYNRTKEGDVYYYNTKDPYSPVQAFWLDTSTGGSKGYGSGYTWFGYINLIVDPTDWNEDKLADPIYWFNLQYIDSKGVGSYKTLYINKSKLQAILQNAGYSL